jgi:hypothetical protein
MCSIKNSTADYADFTDKQITEKSELPLSLALHKKCFLTFGTIQPGLIGAPQARNAKAQGNALGKLINLSRALKARNQGPRSNYSAPSALVTFVLLTLGRWPRLLHFAPSALCKTIIPHHSDFFCKAVCLSFNPVYLICVICGLSMNHYRLD